MSCVACGRNGATASRNDGHTRSDQQQVLAARTCRYKALRMMSCSNSDDAAQSLLVGRRVTRGLSPAGLDRREICEIVLQRRD